MSNEAPRSANTQIKSPNGFVWQFTMREDTASDLLENMEKLEKVLLDKGYTPHEKTFGSGFAKKEKDYLPDRVCPLDKGRLYKTITKTGKSMVKCENGKYDFATKQNIGCDYVEWN